MPEDRATQQEINSWMREYCKKWGFQLEEGEETGYHHWQIRFSLKTKQGLAWVKKTWMTKECYISPTCSDNRDNFHYVEKEETRIMGPWTHEDIRIPSDIRRIQELWPWQEELKDLMLITGNDRKVYVVYDPVGNNGKTTFVRYMGCNKLAAKVPIMNNARDIMRCVMGRKKSTGYMVDMPRALKKEKMLQFWSAIEEVKNGYAFEDRYEFKEEYFDPPNVVVFTNHIPELEMLSEDRWVFFKIVRNELIEFDHKDLNDASDDDESQLSDGEIEKLWGKGKT